MRNRKIVLLSFCVAILCNACKKENFDFKNLAKTEWNPNLAAPLVFSKIEIGDILKQADRNGNIQIDENNFCTLVYKGNLFSLKAEDFIKLPDTTYNGVIALTSAQVVALNANTPVTASNSQTIEFNTGAVELDSMLFKSGNLILNLNSEFPRNAEMTITIPSLKKGGVAYSRVINLNYTGSIPITSSDVTPLSGYRFDLTNGGGTNNRFQVNFQINVNGSGPIVTNAAEAGFTLRFQDPTFSRIFGYIGQQFLSPDRDTVEISIFKTSLGTGSFTLVEPRITVLISNSYGLPIQASFSQFQGYNPMATPQIINITGAPNPLSIISPALNEIGQTKTTTFTLDPSTSNNTIVGALNNNKSKYIVYQLSSQANPGGNTTQNFALDTSRFKVDMEVYLPLHGSAKDFVFQDTTDFSFSKAENIKSGLLRTYIKNGFPIETTAQIYFTDSLFNKLDSLFGYNEIILPGAPVDANGRVTASVEKITDAEFDEVRMEKLSRAKKMLFKASATTTNNGNSNVKIYSDYTLDLKLGLQAKFNLKL